MPHTFSPVCQAERLSLSGPLITFLFSYLLVQRTDEDVNVAVCNYISYIEIDITIDYGIFLGKGERL